MLNPTILCDAEGVFSFDHRYFVTEAAWEEPEHPCMELIDYDNYLEVRKYNTFCKYDITFHLERKVELTC